MAPKTKETSESTAPSPAAARIEAALERARLAQALAWMPQAEGQVLSGSLVGFRIGHTADYGDYPVLVIESIDGYTAFHAFHSLARERLAELKPLKGEIVTIVFGGRRVVNADRDKDPKDQKEYVLYHIEVERDTPDSPVLEDLDFGNFLDDKSKK